MKKQHKSFKLAKIEATNQTTNFHGQRYKYFLWLPLISDLTVVSEASSKIYETPKVAVGLVFIASSLETSHKPPKFTKDIKVHIVRASWFSHWIIDVHLWNFWNFDIWCKIENHLRLLWANLFLIGFTIIKYTINCIKSTKQTTLFPQINNAQ